MIEQIRKMAGYWAVALGIVFVGLLSGCKTGPTNLPPAPGSVFHVGDAITVLCVPVSMTPDAIPPHSERVREDGMITLLYIGSVKAEGKTAGQLQKEIHDLYVPRYFNELNVTVKGESAYFYVDGEVQNRGGKEYPGDMTVVKAIAVAGGFTDFAKKNKVRLTRGGQSIIINVPKAIEDPAYDVPVFPGDRIYVPRRILW
jgi:polysaccharide export outer membrane protein